MPETEEPSRQITLFKDGKWQFRLVTRSSRSESEVNFSFALSKAMSALTGSTPHTANDIAIKPDDVCEIIIGYTAHPQMQALYYGLNYGQARAAVEGNKILLAA